MNAGAVLRVGHMLHGAPHAGQGVDPGEGLAAAIADAAQAAEAPAARHTERLIPLR